MFKIEKAIELLTIWASKTFTDDRSGDCLFDGCSMQPIGSHSITERRILKRVAVDNHVWYFKPSMEMAKVGTNDVSKFGGFCSKHDTEIFKAIDNNDYIPGNKEQEFLFFYRALCKSYSAKIVKIKSYKRLAQLTEENRLASIDTYFKQLSTTPREKILMISFLMQEIEKEEQILHCLKNFKDTMDSYYSNKGFDGVESVIIEFDSEYGLAVAAFSDIGSDFNGNRLPSDIGIGFTVFPQNGKTYVIFSFLRVQADNLGFLRTDLLCESKESQKIIISYLIANSTDNWVLSPATWDRLSDQSKKEFLALSRDTAKEIVINCDEGLNLFV